MAPDLNTPEPEPLSAAGVVHDLGNLIQVASAAINLIARSPEMPAPDREPMLARANSSLERAGALVRQTLGLMLDRTRQAEAVSVAACLLDVKALVDSMGEEALVLDIWLGARLPKVRCDPLGLQNAVLNLIFNARDAMAGNGTVAIGARKVRRGVEIKVADRGVGMSPETIAQAFEPFFTTKSDGMGGVGLPTVERFVREAGGKIAIESRVGVGTTVTVKLPAIQE